MKWRRRRVFLEYSELGSSKLSETSVSVCQSARRHVSEDLNVHQHRCGYLNRMIEWDLNSGTVVYRLLEIVHRANKRFWNTRWSKRPVHISARHIFVCECEPFTYLQIYMLKIRVNFRNTAHCAARSDVSAGIPDEYCNIATLQRCSEV